MRINAVSIKGANIRHIVCRFGVLEYVDEIRDRPVSRMDLHTRVEHDSFAVREGVSGEGGNIAHIIYVGRVSGCFVEEDTTDVDVLICRATAI